MDKRIGVLLIVKVMVSPELDNRYYEAFMKAF